MWPAFERRVCLQRNEVRPRPPEAPPASEPNVCHAAAADSKMTERCNPVPAAAHACHDPVPVTMLAGRIDVRLVGQLASLPFMRALPGHRLHGLICMGQMPLASRASQWPQRRLPPPPEQSRLPTACGCEELLRTCVLLRVSRASMPSYHSMLLLLRHPPGHQDHVTHPAVS